MIAVVVLNWNGSEDTLECLRSLRAQDRGTHIIVVDNASTDDSVARIEASSLADDLIVAEQNLGYAGGNNLGLRRALEEGFERIGVLNNDTVATPGMIERLEVELARTRGAVSPEIHYFDEPGIAWFRGANMYRGRPGHILPGHEATHTEALSGCCIFAPASVWESVGLFDEGYFLIFEDSDWSMRARAFNVDLSVVNDAMLLHKESRSFNRMPSTAPGIFYGSRNWLKFAWRWRRHEFHLAAASVAMSGLRYLKRGEFRSAWAVALAIGAFAIGHRGEAPHRLLL